MEVAGVGRNMRRCTEIPQDTYMLSHQIPNQHNMGTGPPETESRLVEVRRPCEVTVAEAVPHLRLFPLLTHWEAPQAGEQGQSQAGS